MSKRTEINGRGIEVAAHYLSNVGAEVIEREWKCESGVADLIAKEDEDIAFIQVNTRESLSNGLPEDGITKTARARFEKTALAYLASHNLPSCRVRFDVISIAFMGQQAFLRHHRDALAIGA